MRKFGARMKCGKCTGVGHNKRSCPTNRSEASNSRMLRPTSSQRVGSRTPKVTKGKQKVVEKRGQSASGGGLCDPQQKSTVFKKKGISNRKASTSVGGTHSKSKVINIPQLVDERDHTPPLGFGCERRELLPTRVANEARVSPTTADNDEGRVSPPPTFAEHEAGFGVGIIVPPAWGMSIRELTDDLLIPILSMGGPATRTHRSDRIASICHSVPIKNTKPIHIDLTEDISEIEADGRRRTLTRGGASSGPARKGPLTRGGAIVATGTRGGAARGGTVRGGAARGGAVRGGAARGGGTASSSLDKEKGKRIVTTVQKGIEITEAKKKRPNPDWKP